MYRVPNDYTFRKHVHVTEKIFQLITCGTHENHGGFFPGRTHIDLDKQHQTKIQLSL